MRYLVFSDVHANLAALEAVLAAGEQRGAQAFLFVGDLVGYGPDPVECVRRLMELDQRRSLARVAGNHDLVVRGDALPEGYSEEATRTLAWTDRQLRADPAAFAFLRAAPLTVEVDEGIWLAHGSIASPGGESYNREPAHARPELAALAALNGRVCFYGHTHRLRTEVVDGEGRVFVVPMDPQAGAGPDPAPVRLRPGQRAWIGAGSAGFPVNPARAAEYLILDDAQSQVEKYAVDYPRDHTRARILAALPSTCGAAVAERIARWV